jgi:GTP-binding protein HflX
MTRSVELVVPYDRGDVVAALHRSGEVLTETAEQDGMRLSVRLADAERGKFAEFVAAGPAQEAS